MPSDNQGDTKGLETPFAERNGGEMPPLCVPRPALRCLSLAGGTPCQGLGPAPLIRNPRRANPPIHSFALCPFDRSAESSIAERPGRTNESPRNLCRVWLSLVFRELPGAWLPRGNLCTPRRLQRSLSIILDLPPFSVWTGRTRPPLSDGASTESAFPATPPACPVSMLLMLCLVPLHHCPGFGFLSWT